MRVSFVGLRKASAAAKDAALEFLLPIACVSCERLLDAGEPGVVCGLCWSRLRVLPSPQCTRCGHPAISARCSFCALLQPYVRAARSVAWVPGGAAGEIVHALKYSGWSCVAIEMSQRMGRLHWPPDVVDERRALVPVPLSRARIRERGYNQSERLACGLSPAWKIPVWSDVLRRTRATVSQTELTPDERKRNVAGAFEVAPEKEQQIRGAHLVIIDDVMTTAATLNACAAALYGAGARTISYVTFGRARAHTDRL